MSQVAIVSIFLESQFFPHGIIEIVLFSIFIRLEKQVDLRGRQPQGYSLFTIVICVFLNIFKMPLLQFVTLQFSRHKLFYKFSNSSNFNKNKIHLNLWSTPRLQNIPQPIPSRMKRIFFIDIYPTFCYLFLLYVYYDVC